MWRIGLWACGGRRALIGISDFLRLGLPSFPSEDGVHSAMVSGTLVPIERNCVVPSLRVSSLTMLWYRFDFPHQMSEALFVCQALQLFSVRLSKTNRTTLAIFLLR